LITTKRLLPLGARSTRSAVETEPSSHETKLQPRAGQPFPRTEFVEFAHQYSIVKDQNASLVRAQPAGNEIETKKCSSLVLGVPAVLGRWAPG